jgi:hypothetical protein
MSSRLNVSPSVIPRYPGNISIFFAYSHKDKRKQEKLEKHLASLKQEGVNIDFEEIREGKLNGKSHKLLNTAHIIGLLISENFNTSCQKEVIKMAMQRKDKEGVCVIPIYLSNYVYSSNEPYAKLQGLPSNGEFVDSGFWKNQNEAFCNIASGIRTAVEPIRIKSEKQRKLEKKLQRYILVFLATVVSSSFLASQIQQPSKNYSSTSNQTSSLTPKTVSDGWIFIGRVSKTSKPASFGDQLISGSPSIDSSVVPKINSKATVRQKVKLRKNMPQAPNFNPQEQEELGALKSGDKIVILKIKYFVDPNDTPPVTKVWAEVRRY